MSETIIRSAGAADRESIVRLDALLDSSGVDMQLLDLTEDQIDFIESRGPSAGVHLLVAERGNSVVGFAFAAPRSVANGKVDNSSSILLLRRLAVAPGARRSGVGNALLAELQNRITRDPRSMLQAHIPPSAEEFYETEGWMILEPDMALAWIEVPSFAVWEAARSEGVDVGPRRKIAMLRTEDPTADAQSDYNRVAFKVLRQDLIVEYFHFRYGDASSSLTDALGVIAEQIISDPARRKQLPPDVTRLVFDMVIVPRLGLSKANQLRRG